MKCSDCNYFYGNGNLRECSHPDWKFGELQYPYYRPSCCPITSERRNLTGD